MLKQIITVLILAVLLGGCEPMEAKNDVNQAIDASKDVSIGIGSEVKSAIEESVESFTLENAEVLATRPVSVLAAVRNNHDSDAVFDIIADCRGKRLINSETLSVKAGESASVELLVDPTGMEGGRYMCTISAESNKGDSYSKIMMIVIR